MDVLIKKSEFTKGLGIANAVADTKRAMPILQNVLIATTDRGVDLIATDLDIGMRASYDAEVNDAGTVAVSARKLHDIVRELPEEDIRLTEAEERRLLIVCGQSSFRLPCMDVEDFPPLPNYEESELLSFEAKDLVDMIRKIIYASSTDATRIALNGALMESDGKVLHFAATDGNRLAYVRKNLETPPPEPVSALLPRKALAELQRLLSDGNDPVRLTLQKNHAIFLCQNVVLISRVLEGQFPNYQEVIPKQTTKRLVVNRQDFINALRRVSLLANEKSHLVKFAIKPSSLLLTSTDVELGEAKEEVAIQYSGEAFEVSFNARFFLEPVGVIDSTNVVFSLSGTAGACLIASEDSEDFKSVVMPMRT